MSAESTEYARLSDDTYRNHQEGDKVVIAGVAYSMLDTFVPTQPLEPLKPAASTRLDHPSRPDYAMFLQVREGVDELDAAWNRISDHRSDQLAAALVVAARRNGLTHIDDVTLHRDRAKAGAPGKTPLPARTGRRPTSIDPRSALCRQCNR